MELIYLKSPTGLQHDRALRVLARVKEARPDVAIREVDPTEDPEFAKRFKIKYSPGLIIDGRIEFVGIPREGMLLERLELISQGIAALPVQAPSPQRPAPSPSPEPPPGGGVQGMSPEERQRRIEEAKKKAEGLKREREAQGKA